MTAIELDVKKMEIFRRILDVKDENILAEIEELLYGISSHYDIFSYYSSKTLHEAVLRSEEDFRNGRIHTMEDVRKRFSANGANRTRTCRLHKYVSLACSRKVV